MKTLFTALVIAIGYCLSVIALGLLVPTIVCILVSNIFPETFIELLQQPGYWIFSVIGCIIAMIYYGVEVYTE